MDEILHQLAQGYTEELMALIKDPERFTPAYAEVIRKWLHDNDIKLCTDVKPKAENMLKDLDFVSVEQEQWR